MLSEVTVDLQSLKERLKVIRKNPELLPNVSVVIPVNAKGDLQNVLHVIADITQYNGNHSIEVVLVINNYDPSEPPPEISSYGELGMKIINLPNVRKPGEAVGFTARIPGIQAASSEIVILFDSDCRIPNASALIDWYIQQFNSGAKAAYTHVDYYGLADGWSIRLRMFVHHSARWVKRVILNIPTTRGSNYAVARSLMQELYGQGFLADEMNVGPTFKSVGARIAYSGERDLIVLTSGRMFTNAGLKKLLRYFRYRLRYNLRVLPVHPNAARRTRRESDPVRQYIDNKPTT